MSGFKNFFACGLCSDSKTILMISLNQYVRCCLVGETVTFSAVVWREKKLYVAWCPELDVASQGKDVEHALGNLQEAVELYLEDEDATVSLGHEDDSHDY
jgi:predicted RNase H-like HicB family nuclease